MRKFQKNKNTLYIFLLALLIRVSVVFSYAYGFFNGGLKGADSKLYFQIARNLLAGNGFATEHGPTAFVSPLYPLFLAGCMSIVGENYIVISLVQAFLSALACVFIYKISLLTFKNPTVALTSGILAAIHYELILWSNAQLLTEPIYVVLLSAAVMTLLAGVRKTRHQNLFYIISGLTFALASLARPTAIAIAVGLLVILLGASVFGNNVNWRGAIIFAMVFSAVMFPWGLRNYFVFESFTVSSMEGGHVFWLGNNLQYDTYEHPDFKRFGGYTAMIKPDNNLLDELKEKSSVEQNKIFADTAWAHIKSNPGAFIRRAAHKNWNMWRPNFSGSSWRNGLISYTFYPLMLITALLGICLTWRSFGRGLFKKLGSPGGILIAIFLMHILIHSVITGEIRFRVPLWVVLLPFSAYSICHVISIWRSAISETDVT